MHKWIECKVSFGDKLNRTLTWWRVPLLLIPSALLVLYVNRMDAFLFGAAVAVFGQLIQTWSGAHIHKDMRHTVSGPYCYVRNQCNRPFFPDVWLCSDAVEHYVNAVFVVLFAIYAHLRVLREEPRLKELFAADYERYCSEVNRWLPKVNRYSGAEPRKASWECVRENHEDIHFIALIIILAALFLRILYLPDLWDVVFHR